MRAWCIATVAACLATTVAGAQVSAADYPSIQAAVDAHPGKMVLVPDGDHLIDAAIRIGADGSGLYGFGRIVQRNPEAAIVEVHGARDVRIRDLTLTRAFAVSDDAARWEDALEGSARPGIEAVDCDGFEVEGVRVIDNKSAAASIRLERCRHSRVRNSLVRNYKRLSVDDRTESEQYGYAFRVIDGSGIVATEGRDIAIEGNRVVEDAVLPTPEMKAAHGLGTLVEGRRPTQKGPLAPKGEYANNWHQGSAIVVTAPEASDFIRVTDNYIENAAQGIDLHADRVVCSGNLVNGAFIGVKTMHGSRNVIVSHNNLARIDLWGICLQPGTASRAHPPERDGQPARPANLTAGIVLANNVFSDFGRGLEAFNWEGGANHAISLQWGPLAENPPMTDVLVTGNVVYDTERESGDPARYAYALFLDERLDRARFVIEGNLFHPGTRGVTNFEPAP